MVETEYSIKPESGTPKLDTSDWPLLLKVIIISLSLWPIKE
jgi:hypothetical protein